MTEGTETAAQVGRALSHLLSSRRQEPPAGEVQILMARLLQARSDTAADALVLATWAMQLTGEVKRMLEVPSAAQDGVPAYLLAISEALMHRTKESLETVLGRSTGIPSSGQMPN